jgi:two-component system, OmpR family, sensor kinase
MVGNPAGRLVAAVAETRQTVGSAMRESVVRRSLGLAATAPAPPTGTEPVERAGDVGARNPGATVPTATAWARPEAASPRRRLGARARLLAVYVVLLVLAAVLSTLAIRAILVVSLNERVENALENESREIDRHVTAGRNPVTGQAFPTLEALFDSYFAQHVPDNDEAVLTFINGELHRSNMDYFPLEEIPAPYLASWAVFSAGPPDDGLAGELETSLGDGRFQTVHVTLGEETGAFAAAILPAGELKEIGEVQRYGIGVTLGVLLLASAAAWLIVGRSLAPVRDIAATAWSISESDLTRRVDVRGSDEAAAMAQSFNSMLDRLETSFRGQQEFIQDAGHELRRPLTVCRGHLAFIGDDPDEQHVTVALALDELDRMGRTVDELQLLAELEQPNFIRPETFELGAFTQDLLAGARVLAPRKWLFEQGEDGQLLADRFRLTQAVMNLVQNAVQHTAPDDFVTIGSSASDGEARIWVRDTGPGILLSDRERIFERFTRGRSTYRENPGSGLGLAIVRRIAEAHGGRVELESRLGVGSTFTVVLPLSPEGESGSWPGS